MVILAIASPFSVFVCLVLFIYLCSCVVLVGSLAGNRLDVCPFLLLLY